MDLIALLYVTFPDDLTLFNFGNTVPSPDKRGRPWIRTNADGTPDGVWVYAMGSWLQKHEVAAGTVVMYEGTEGSIDTFDGGEAGAVTSISGPFWEKVSEMDGKVPLGPGTLQPSGTVVALDDTGGADEHELTIAEMPEHDHSYATLVQGGDADNGGANGTTPTTGTTGTTGGGDAHPTMPPYRGIFFIRKTDRLYRRI